MMNSAVSIVMPLLHLECTNDLNLYSLMKFHLGSEEQFRVLDLRKTLMEFREIISANNGDAFLYRSK